MWFTNGLRGYESEQEHVLVGFVWFIQNFPFMLVFSHF